MTTTVRAVVTMLRDGLIEPQDAIVRLPEHLVADGATSSEIASPAIGRGLAAAPGVAAGRVAMSTDVALELSDDGEPVVLVVEETSPHDLPGLSVASAVVTTRGGVTSHAAVVSRSLGIPCIVGLGSSEIDPGRGELVVDGSRRVTERSAVVVDGSAGTLHPDDGAGAADTHRDLLDELLRALDADERGIDVFAAADEQGEVVAGVEAGAAGVGPCRLGRLLADRCPDLLAHAYDEDRGAAAAEVRRRLRDEARATVTNVIGTAGALPVMLRLVDGSDGGTVVGAPGLLAAQLDAVADAHALAVRRGRDAPTTVLVPSVTDAAELRFVADLLRSIVARRSEPLAGLRLGAMIETPRAVLDAASFAAEVEALVVGSAELAAHMWGAPGEREHLRLLDVLRAAGATDDGWSAGDRPVDRLLADALDEVRAAHGGVRIGIVDRGDEAAGTRALLRAQRIGADFVSVTASRVRAARVRAARAAATAGDGESPDG